MGDWHGHYITLGGGRPALTGKATKGRAQREAAAEERRGSLLAEVLEAVERKSAEARYLVAGGGSAALPLAPFPLPFPPLSSLRDQS